MKEVGDDLGEKIGPGPLVQTVEADTAPLRPKWRRRMPRPRPSRSLFLSLLPELPKDEPFDLPSRI